MICAICSYESSGKDFSNHLQRDHKLKSKDYTVQYIYKKQPICEHCGNETRYVAYKFKRFCKDCSKIASSIGGKAGGKSPAWNRGLTKETDERVRIQAERNTGKNNPFFGRAHTLKTRSQISKTKTLNRIALQQRIDERSNDFELITNLDEYYSRQKQYLDFKCRKCDTISQKTLQAFERGSLCPTCYPISRSQFEIEINDFIESLGIQTKTSDRTLIGPKELDIIVPSKNLAVEANGLYWHAENDRDESYDKRRHINKTIDCLDKNYRLMHIFSDEWNNKKDICKSMIINRLGVSSIRIHARKCQIKEITKEKEKQFFQKTHISGFTPSRKCFALFYDDKIISAISLRIPRQKKYNGMIEIARYSSELYHQVMGGLGKLMSHVLKYAKENNCEGILTYSDRRFGEGNGYLKCGFSLAGNTGLDYWYTDGQIRIDRFAMRTEPGKTEKQKMYENKLMKIHGCGNNMYILLLYTKSDLSKL